MVTSQSRECLFYLNLLCVCTLVTVCPLSNIITGVERTAGPIRIKFGMSTWGGWAIVLK